MPVLLESPSRPLSIKDVAAISTQLAEDLSKLNWKSEGFSIDDYLTLDGNYLVEYIDGRIQVLPMPSPEHQELQFIYKSKFRSWCDAHDPAARVLAAPFFVRVSEGQVREPDVCVMTGANAHRRTSKVWNGADVVVEIISESNRAHDLDTKRREYAAAGIPEYWIVDPETRTVGVLTLRGTRYVEHGIFGAGETATSVLLAGFSLDVGAAFDEAERRAR